MFCFVFNFYWSIADLQCCVVSDVQKSESIIHIYMSILFQVIFPFRLFQNIEQSSLCYTVVPCSLLVAFLLSICKILILWNRDRLTVHLSCFFILLRTARLHAPASLVLRHIHRLSFSCWIIVEVCVSLTDPAHKTAHCECPS